ncbi:SusC/RagA family TonB-linked outer membrane protein [Saccharicrinis fermentans]|uniref:SusC/RagA family TonB-linked outer membrane protein n=1 Tax=Saccharicrinis fermentans TaxID=982 RepID=UPI000484130C|nr:SusC/RagA family TonB-linked outer membrane protein [Saccharicrinis fermentans]
MKLLIATIVLLGNLVMLTDANAQSGVTITGKVTSSDNGEPLVGVTVAEKNSSNRFINGTITDFNGNYSITIRSTENTLSFSFIGLDTKVVVPGNKKVVNVELDETAVQIDEFVVSARKMVNDGEFAMDPKRVATAVQTIDMKDVTEVSSTSLSDQIQGRLSGVEIVAQSGDPGAGMSIRIRGTSSLNTSSEPLIVINGIPFETQFDDTFDFSVADEQEYAALIGVSADDIAEISVLKDAAATAQYGSKGANGVLMITTKRGTPGKAVFSYGFRGSLSQQPDGIPLLNGHQYSTLIKEETLQLGKNKGTYPQVEYDPSYELYDYYNHNINWLDEITQIGHTQDHNFSVSGGGEKAMYRISSSYKSQKGTTMGTANELFTTRAILDYLVSDKLRITSELSFSHGSLDKAFQLTDKSATSIRNVALIKMPNQSIYELDEFGNSTGAYFTPEDAFQGSGITYYNPVAMANLATYNVESNRISPTFRVRYDVTPSIRYDGIISFDANNNETLHFVPEEALGTYWSGSYANKASQTDSEFFVVRTENRVTWMPKLNDDHSLFLNAKFITYDKTTQTYKVSTSNSPSTLLQSPIIDTRIEGSGNSIESGYTQYRQLTYSAAFNYMFKNRYIIGGGLNYEGSSRFGDDNRYGLFPSVSAKWLINEESFLKTAHWIDELSVRASYGKNGNSPGFNYGQYNVYSTYDYNYIDVRPAYSSSIELDGLKWETVTQENVGFNARMFRGRLDADFDLYLKRTEDMLSKNTSIPTTSGYSSLAYLNIGTIENKGWEFNVMSTLVKRKNFKLDFNFNISQNINEIVEITDAMDVEEGNALSTGSDGYVRRIQEDNPIGSFYGYKYLGVYSTSDDLYARDANGDIIYDMNGEAKMMMFNNTNLFEAGDARYADINHDGNINELDVVYIGNANTKLHGGFGPRVTYKDISLNIFFNFRYKQDVVNLARMNTESMSGYDNQSTATLRRWRFEGDETDIPRAYYNSPKNNLGSDRYLEDASFLRLKSVTLKYNLPKSLLKTIGFTRANVYITGQNLLTFTKYTGPDPETGASSNWKNLGFDSNQTPRSRQVTLGLNLSF